MAWPKSNHELAEILTDTSKLKQTDRG